jgi:hypothetical protein
MSTKTILEVRTRSKRCVLPGRECHAVAIEGGRIRERTWGFQPYRRFFEQFETIESTPRVN